MQCQLDQCFKPLLTDTSQLCSVPNLTEHRRTERVAENVGLPAAHASFFSQGGYALESTGELRRPCNKRSSSHLSGVNFSPLVFQDSPLLSLLVQSTSLPWHQLDLSSYQSILGYVSTHYPSSLLLSGDSAPQLLLKSLRSAAGLHPRPTEAPHQVGVKMKQKVSLQGP